MAYGPKVFLLSLSQEGLQFLKPGRAVPNRLHSPFRKCEPKVNNGKELNTLYVKLIKSTWKTSEGCSGQEILRKDIGLSMSSEEWKD